MCIYEYIHIYSHEHRKIHTSTYMYICNPFPKRRDSEYDLEWELQSAAVFFSDGSLQMVSATLSISYSRPIPQWLCTLSPFTPYYWYLLVHTTHEGEADGFRPCLATLFSCFLVMCFSTWEWDPKKLLVCHHNPPRSFSLCVWECGQALVGCIGGRRPSLS